MAADPRTLEGLARELRRLVNLMRSIGEASAALSGVTVGMRAVMEALVTDGPRTVPEVARSRGVSRQHIQVVVNELLEAGLAATQTNPAHKRSPQIAITPAGERLLAEIRAREAPLWERLARDFAEPDLAAALVAARRAGDRLETMLGEIQNGDA